MTATFDKLRQQKYWGFGNAEGFAIYDIQVVRTHRWLQRIGDPVAVVRSPGLRHEPPLAMRPDSKRLFDDLPKARRFVLGEIEEAQRKLRTMETVLRGQE